MDAVTKPRRRTDRGARSNVIAMPASELPTDWYNVVPDLPVLRELPEVQA